MIELELLKTALLLGGLVLLGGCYGFLRNSASLPTGVRCGSPALPVTDFNA